MKRFILVCLLMGCAAPPHVYKPPVPPLPAPPDATVFYIEGSSDILNTTILYRESILAYSQYLVSYAEKLNVELGIPKPPTIPQAVVPAHSHDSCRRLLESLPVLKLGDPPDVDGFTDEEIISTLLSYIEETSSRVKAYKESLSIRKAEMLEKC